MKARAPLNLYGLATLLVLALGMTGARQRSEGPAELPYEVIEISVTSDDATLAGTLTLPHGDGPLRWLADHRTRHRPFGAPLRAFAGTQRPFARVSEPPACKALTDAAYRGMLKGIEHSTAQSSGALGAPASCGAPPLSRCAVA